jgi:hypothetical protein
MAPMGFITPVSYLVAVFAILLGPPVYALSVLLGPVSYLSMIRIAKAAEKIPQLDLGYHMEGFNHEHLVHDQSS